MKQKLSKLSAFPKCSIVAVPNVVIRFEKASIVLKTVSLASVLMMNGRASFVVSPVSVQCRVW